MNAWTFSGYWVAHLVAYLFDEIGKLRDKGSEGFSLDGLAGLFGISFTNPSINPFAIVGILLDVSTNMVFWNYSFMSEGAAAWGRAVLIFISFGFILWAMKDILMRFVQNIPFVGRFLGGGA